MKQPRTDILKLSAAPDPSGNPLAVTSAFTIRVVPKRTSALATICGDDDGRRCESHRPCVRA